MAIRKLRPSDSENSPEVSVVVPLYNEEDNLPELYQRVSESLISLGVSFELVLVNDGSTDSTADILDDLAWKDPRVVAIHLSRNFGHQPAITAGLDHARGQAIAVMDGDLQDPPEVLGQFLDAWRQGSDVVYAIRTRRKEGLFKRTAYALFYRLLHATSDLKIPCDSGDFCIMDRRVVESLRQLPERRRFIRGLRAFVGFKQMGLAYERDARHCGTPKYTFKSLCRLAADGLFGFSSMPLALVTYCGLASLFLALGLTGWVAIDALRHRTGPPSWVGLALVILYMGSVQLLSLGIVAEYIQRIFQEVKQRPTYLVAHIRRGQTGASSEWTASKQKQSA